MNQQNFQHGTYDPNPRLSPLAVVSFIAGAFGFMGLPIPASLIAIWAGHAAQKKTRAASPTASGDNTAGAGILMGWIQIWMIIIAVVLWFLYLGYTSIITG